MSMNVITAIMITIFTIEGVTTNLICHLFGSGSLALIINFDIGMIGDHFHSLTTTSFSTMKVQVAVTSSTKLLLLPIPK